MAFPSSPGNGDVYGNHRWDSTIGAWIKFPVASQAEAEAGTAENVQMVPLRTEQNVSDHPEVDANTIHKGSDGSDHSNVVLNNTYRTTSSTITTKSASFIITDSDNNVFEVTTGATDITATLPTLSANLGREIEIHKVDSGIGKIIVDGEGVESIDGTTSIDIDSQYDYCKLRGGTAGWHLIEYKDHGSDTEGEWSRRTDGSMRCIHNLTIDDSNNVSGSVYRTDENTWTFPAAFATGTVPSVTALGATADNEWGGGGVVTNTTAKYRVYTQAARTGTDVQLIAEGRWRT